MTDSLNLKHTITYTLTHSLTHTITHLPLEYTAKSGLTTPPRSVPVTLESAGGWFKITRYGGRVVAYS